MSETSEHSGIALSSSGERELRGLIATNRSRVSQVEIEGQLLWIKRYDIERRPYSQRLHAILSPIMPLPALRASPLYSGADLAFREERKAAQFRNAGLQTPQILLRDGPVLVVADISGTVQTLLQRLRADNQDAHEEMLVEMGDALGTVHGAQLCHGRPHMRDMFRNGCGWGFFDFEEEPEAVMPIQDAQARDVWLAFQQIAMQALRPDTPQRAFNAWRAHASPETVASLRRLVRFTSYLVPALQWLNRRIKLGSDGKRVLVATVFLRSALRDNP
jgi:hypothetical protein